MKYILIFLFFLHNINLKCEDYIIDNNGTRTVITEHNYSDRSLFRAFKLVGTFTDNLGNYGDWNAFVTTYITDKKITKLDFSAQFKYQNRKSVFLQGFRKEGAAMQAGVGRSTVTFTDKELEKLLSSKCVYSVKFLDENIFGKTKCKINAEALNVLTNLQESVE